MGVGRPSQPRGAGDRHTNTLAPTNPKMHTTHLQPMGVGGSSGPGPRSRGCSGTPNAAQESKLASRHSPFILNCVCDVFVCLCVLIVCAVCVLCDQVQCRCGKRARLQLAAACTCKPVQQGGIKCSAVLQRGLMTTAAAPPHLEQVDIAPVEDLLRVVHACVCAWGTRGCCG